MTWNYRVLKTEDPKNRKGYDTFSIITVYYDENGDIESWSDASHNLLIWSTYEDLKGTAELVQCAFDKPVLTADPNDRLSIY